jgi:hypothetical protein
MDAIWFRSVLGMNFDSGVGDYTSPLTAHWHFDGAETGTSVVSGDYGGDFEAFFNALLNISGGLPAGWTQGMHDFGSGLQYYFYATAVGTAHTLTVTTTGGTDINDIGNIEATGAEDVVAPTVEDQTQYVGINNDTNGMGRYSDGNEDEAGFTTHISPNTEFIGYKGFAVVDGAECWETEAGSWPPRASLMPAALSQPHPYDLPGEGQYTQGMLDDAVATWAYNTENLTVATPGDWDSLPATVPAALNELAARLRALEP